MDNRDHKPMTILLKALQLYHTNQKSVPFFLTKLFNQFALLDSSNLMVLLAPVTFLFPKV